MDDYNEDDELTRYVWEHFKKFLTPEETVAANAVTIRGAERKSPSTAAKLREQWGVSEDDPIVKAALVDGVKEFRDRVRDRILAEESDNVSVNRCPACNRVVKSPLSQQCLWCGHDWHS